jgi:ankyrin repeat protein
MLSLLLEHLYIDTGAAQTMQSLLRLFVERDWVQAVQRLIDYGVNYRFDNDLIFLLTALRGRVDIMRVLLDLGIDVNLKDGLALRQAVLRGQSAVVHLLLDHGARSADRALRWAAAFGDAELCGQLIDRGANVHTHQDRPVFEAVRGGFVTTVRVLLDRGANPTAKSGQAIKLARKNGNVEMVRLFDDWLIKNSI